MRESSWPPVSLHQRLMDLGEVKKALHSSGRDGSDGVEGALARYLVIRAAGYLEAVRDDVADAFAEAKASPEVIRRVRHHLRGGQGVRPNQLLDFVKSFNPDWHNELETLLDEDDGRLRSDIGALVAARTKIAHGDGETVTPSRALVWCEASEKLSKWLIFRFDPTS